MALICLLQIIPRRERSDNEPCDTTLPFDANIELIASVNLA